MARDIFQHESGGRISANYGEATKEEAENVAALMAFALHGSSVVLMKAVNKQKIRSADCTIDGVEWEVKTNRKATASAIDNALRSCNGQSKNLILNLTSGITDELLLRGMKSRIHRTSIERIVVERNGEIVRTYSRNDIIGQ